MTQRNEAREAVVAELRALMERATERPWTLAPAGVVVGADGRRICNIPVRLDSADAADTLLIPAAINALPMLLDALTPAADEQGEVERLRTALEPFARTNPHKNELGSASVLIPATIADVRRAREALASRKDG